MSEKEFDVELIVGFHYQWRDSVDFARMLAGAHTDRVAVKKRNGFWVYGFSTRKERYLPKGEPPVLLTHIENAGIKQGD